MDDLNVLECAIVVDSSSLDGRGKGNRAVDGDTSELESGWLWMRMVECQRDGGRTKVSGDGRAEGRVWPCGTATDMIPWVSSGPLRFCGLTRSLGAQTPDGEDSRKGEDGRVSTNTLGPSAQERTHRQWSRLQVSICHCVQSERITITWLTVILQTWNHLCNAGFGGTIAATVESDFGYKLVSDCFVVSRIKS